MFTAYPESVQQGRSEGSSPPWGGNRPPASRLARSAAVDPDLADLPGSDEPPVSQADQGVPSASSSRLIDSPVGREPAAISTRTPFEHVRPERLFQGHGSQT